MRSVLALSTVAIAILVASAGLSIVGNSYALGAPTTTTSTSTECVPTSDPFVVTGAAWGTASSTYSAGPGENDVPLTVTLLYTGGCELTAASFQLQPSLPLASSEGANTTTNYEVNVADDSVLTETYHLNIGGSASLGNYEIPLYIGFNTSDFAGIFFESTNVAIVLRGSADLQYRANTGSLVPGQVNNLTVTVTNDGSGNATAISTTVTAPSQVAVLNQLTGIGALPAGSSASLPLEVYVPTSLAGGATSLTFASSYYDAYLTQSTATQVIGFDVAQNMVVSTSLGVSALSGSAMVGSQTSIAFILENFGTGAIFSPSVSVTASSPIVVVGISPVNSSQEVLPGTGIEYDLVVGSSPGSSPGIYSGAITVTYLDSSGASHTQTFGTGIVLKGSVDFVLQDVTVSQASTDITVSGSLLNEGSEVAYYAQATGAVAGSPSESQASYIGEVDTNTPTPFTVTIPFAAPTSPKSGANITIHVTYKDTFGSVLSYTGFTSVNLESASQLAFSSATTKTGSTSGGDLLVIVSYSVIGVVIAAVVGGVVFIRRNRPKATKADKVI